MNYPLPSRNARRRGFTLIEMLVVIAIITILAGLVIPLAGIAAKKKKISQAQSQISAIQVAIGQYKNKKGFYPPDNPNSAGQNQLVYELAGAKVDSATGNFIDSLKNTTITPLNMTAIFSAGGIVNSSADPSDVGNYMAGLNINTMIKQVNTAPVQIWVFANPTAGPASGNLPAVGGGFVNPIRYNSSSPTNNLNGYDLWVDIILGNTTNRISNWSADPQVVH